MAEIPLPLQILAQFGSIHHVCSLRVCQYLNEIIRPRIVAAYCRRWGAEPEFGVRHINIYVKDILPPDRIVDRVLLANVIGVAKILETRFNDDDTRAIPSYRDRMVYLDKHTTHYSSFIPVYITQGEPPVIVTENLQMVIKYAPYPQIDKWFDVPDIKYIQRRSIYQNSAILADDTRIEHFIIPHQEVHYGCFILYVYGKWTTMPIIYMDPDCCSRVSIKNITSSSHDESITIIADVSKCSAAGHDVYLHFKQKSFNDMIVFGNVGKW